MSLKDKILIPLFVFFLVAGFGLLAWSGTDNHRDSYLDHQDEFKTKIENCILMGGTPQYTSTSTGRIRDYFGCVTP